MRRQTRSLFAALTHQRRLALALIGAGVALWLGALVFPAPPPFQPPSDRPRHVVVLGIDGLTARALFKGNTPTLDRLMTEGTGTLTAEAVMPTMSSANWASHLMGAGPRRHGIRFNDWRPDWWDGVAMCDRPTGAGWPTVFEALKTAAPGARVAVIYDWVGIGRFAPRAWTDRRAFAIWPRRAVRLARRELRRRGPALMFVQLDHVDGAGHEHGFDSWQYHRAVARADAMVAQILRTITRSGARERTLLMVISDHGGRGTIHGQASPEEVLVPLILHGTGVRNGQPLGEVSVRDTAPTIAHSLGIPAPDCWTGRALAEGFHFAAP